MGRRPCCSKEGLNKGSWTALEDKILTAYIKAHGEGKWRNLPKRAGLKRCGKSCRLRWLNYLRPDIKRGNISHDEEELIIRLHNLLGNRWSLIAGRLPGRTDNEIKNYWNTTLGKKAKAQSSPNSPPPAIAKQSSISKSEPRTADPSNSPQAAATQTQVIRTKAIRCTKVLIPPLLPANEHRISNSTVTSPSEPDQAHQSQLVNYHQDLENSKADHYGTEKQLPETCGQDSDLFNFGEDYNFNNSMSVGDHQSLPFDETMFKDWTSNYCCLEDNANLDLESFAFLFD